MTRSYFSQRAGRTPDNITFEHLKRILDIRYRKFLSEGYFQHSFGYECVDNGFVQGTLKLDLREQLIITFSGKGEAMFPTSENIMKLDYDSLFDLIEFLYDYIAKPTKSNYHSWNNCGIHVTEVSIEEGRQEWRDELNKSLMLLDTPYRLTNDGTIEMLPPSEGLQDLVDKYELPIGAENIDNRVKHACNLFLKRGSNIDEKRDALKNLADVLEFLRKDLRDYIPTDEENDIFNIANNFGIRHHNTRQKTQYDQEPYFTWIFYSYLSTIDLFAKLKNQTTK